jgi:hypothetical protein
MVGMFLSAGQSLSIEIQSNRRETAFGIANTAGKHISNNINEMAI